MKRIVYILTLFILAINLSCSKNLDVEPTNAITLEDAVKSAEGLTYLQNASYAYARNIYGQYFIHFAELLADTNEINVSIYAFKEWNYLKYRYLDNSFIYAEESWYYSYKAINNANLILDNLNVVEDTDERAILEGNAKFIRALLYFDLTRFFGIPYGNDYSNNPAVPLQTHGIARLEDTVYLSKSTVGEVFGQVEDDLLDAYNLLPPDEAFFASHYAAAAILSRYYLTVEDYENAALYANQVIESGYFGLTPNPFDAYNNAGNSTEDVFAWQQTELDNVGSNNSGLTAFYSDTDEGGRGDFAISYEFIGTVYDTLNDLRGGMQRDVHKASKINSMFYFGFGHETSDGIQTSKWIDYSANIPCVRLAEMYLTRAEANQNLIDDSQPMVGTTTPTNDIKTIRSRAGLDVSTPIVVTMDEIRLERYKELIFEGHRLHDTKRWHHSVGDIPYDSDWLIIPIPKRETDANPNI